MTGPATTLGLLFDVRNPAAWQQPWGEVIGSALDQVVEAERLGAGSIWATEHHNFEDGYLSQPLTFLASAAARTTRIRLGTGVLLASMRHPRHISEQAALIDQISGGRLELGVGAGYAAEEFELFGRDLSKRMTLADAKIRELKADLWDGALNPPPTQERLPLWLGYQGPQGAKRAGRLGVGLLAPNAALLPSYLEGLSEGGHDPALAAMGGMIPMVLATDPERTAQIIAPHYAHQTRTYAQARVTDGSVVAAQDHDEVVKQLLDPTSRGLRVVEVATAAAELGALRAAAPIRHLYFWASVAAMPQSVVAEHMSLIFGPLAEQLGISSQGPVPDQARLP
ncbi:LLM class flavin-dependent oxidoreductase [Nocardioides sp. Bht2]|uniref:LLM class flavin-dependent oxidoreductase n=1 Tax=Nocardioides sp. Bht2 TaxID=3392297 RepID=UPI0039B5B1A2